MATASVEIPSSTDHVRLARLVAGAAARRCGVNEEVLDEVRLAVGEACARAVLRNQAADSEANVQIQLDDGTSEFVVTVHDSATSTPDDDAERLALALIESLAPVSQVEMEAGGSKVRMSWPIDPLQMVI